MNPRSFLFHTVAAAVLLATSLTAQAGGYGHSRTHFRYSGHGDIALGVFAGLLFGYTVLSHRGHYAHRHNRDYVGHTHQRRTTYQVQRVEDVCVKEDRYLTSVIIDGRAVEAWGIACLTPKGIWRRKRS
jgi:hypothetical protein